MTAVIERCAMCGGDLGSARVIVGNQTFHPRCSHDARDQRIAELEAVLIRIAALAYSYNAETPDKRFVELAEAARVAAGEARY